MSLLSLTVAGALSVAPAAVGAAGTPSPLSPSDGAAFTYGGDQATVTFRVERADGYTSILLSRTAATTPSGCLAETFLSMPTSQVSGNTTQGELVLIHGAFKGPGVYFWQPANPSDNAICDKPGAIRRLTLTPPPAPAPFDPGPSSPFEWRLADLDKPRVSILRSSDGGEVGKRAYRTVKGSIDGLGGITGAGCATNGPITLRATRRRAPRMRLVRPRRGRKIRANGRVVATLSKIRRVRSRGKPGFRLHFRSSAALCSGRKGSDFWEADGIPFELKWRLRRRVTDDPPSGRDNSGDRTTGCRTMGYRIILRNNVSCATAKGVLRRYLGGGRTGGWRCGSTGSLEDGCERFGPVSSFYYR